MLLWRISLPASLHGWSHSHTHMHTCMSTKPIEAYTRRQVRHHHTHIQAHTGPEQTRQTNIWLRSMSTGQFTVSHVTHLFSFVDPRAQNDLQKRQRRVHCGRSPWEINTDTHLNRASLCPPPSNVAPWTQQDIFQTPPVFTNCQKFNH